MELDPLPPPPDTQAAALAELKAAALNVLAGARLLESLGQQTDIFPSIITDTTRGMSRSLNEAAQSMVQAIAALSGQPPEPISAIVPPTLAVKLGDNEEVALSRQPTRSAKRRLGSKRRARAALGAVSRAEGRS